MKNVLWNTIGSLAYQVSQWLATILVVLLSSSYENSGILAIAMATGNVFTALATYNMRTFQISDIRNEYSSGNYVGFRIVTTIAAFIVCALYTLAFGQLEILFAVTTFLFFKADEAFATVLYGIDQKNNRVDYVGVSQVIRACATLFAFCLVLYFSGNLSLAIIAMFFGGLTVTLFYDLPRSKRFGVLTPELSAKMCMHLLRTMAPVVGTAFLYAAVSTIARQSYGFLYGEEMLGIYAAIATPCVLVQAVINYVYTPLLTPLSVEIHARNRSGYKKRLLMIVSCFVGISIACLVGALAIGKPIIDFIYGASIESYSYIVTECMLAAIFLALGGLLTDLLIVIRKPKASFAVNLIAVCVCSLAIAPLSSSFGVNGVNYSLISSFGISSIFGVVLYAFYSNKLFGVQKDKK